ncbi:MAG: gamma-glutamyl-gamma-aminobutyrate hydrolase family protein [Candidatus Nitrosotenuis sp.]
MSKILVIQNARLEGPGTLGELLKSDGFDLDVVYAKKEKLPQLDHAAVLVMGAPESANDDLQYLKDEMRLIRQSVQQNVPTLGICLGSQLIAKAFGARVYAGQKKEIGFYHDVKIDTNTNSVLFAGLSNPFTVFHWHGDTFEIPQGGKRLAYSDIYNQAFQYGSAIAIQFHLEVDKEIITSWLDNTQENIDLPYINPETIRSEAETKASVVRKNMEIFYRNFRTKFAF